MTPTPTLRLERKCWEAGERVVVGIDEVGRGAWAGRGAPLLGRGGVRWWHARVGGARGARLVAFHVESARRSENEPRRDSRRLAHLGQQRGDVARAENDRVTDAQAHATGGMSAH